MNLPYAVTAMVAVLVVGDAAVDSRRQTLPIDRWLISEAFAPDSSMESRLEEDVLEAPGEVGVLPDRGTASAGATWRLHRTDGVPDVSLDSPPGSVVYAHVYARFPEDRTVDISWSPEACTAGRLWLNGRPTEGNDITARFGAGWNTILIKLESGDCGFGFMAALVGDGAADLDGVRLQASRPPGDVRTGPEPWAIPHDTVVVTADRLWRGDRLFAGLGVRVTAWGRSPISEVRVELKGNAGGKGEGQWLTPGETTEIVVPIRLDRLSSVLEAGSVESRIRWDGGDLVTNLAVFGSVDETSPNLVLDGWEVSGEGQFPNAAGWTLQGEWKVPSDLDGRTLVLVTAGSPANYRVNGSEAVLVDDSLSLCAPCARGTVLTIEATTTGAWQGMPVIRASGPVGQ